MHERMIGSAIYLLLMTISPAIPFTVLNIKPLFAAVIYATDFPFDIIGGRHRVIYAACAAS